MYKGYDYGSWLGYGKAGTGANGRFLETSKYNLMNTLAVDSAVMSFFLVGKNCRVNGARYVFNSQRSGGDMSRALR